MIIVPELKTVVILVPRTGSGTLHRAISKAYPKSFLIYRHMEADGVPAGYDWWPKIGVVREPVARLYSCFKYLKTMTDLQYPNEAELERATTDKGFEHWLLNSTIPFAPGHYHNNPDFTPFFTVRHFIPENRKSQFLYLRPDLGTKVYHFDRMDEIYDRLDIAQPPLNERKNVTPDDGVVPVLSLTAWDHLHRHFRWDIENWESRRRAWRPSRELV